MDLVFSVNTASIVSGIILNVYGSIKKGFILTYQGSVDGATNNMGWLLISWKFLKFESQ